MDDLHAHNGRSTPSAARPRRAPQGEGELTLPASIGGRPDRVAFWAVVLTAFTLLVAAASAQGRSTGGATPQGSAGNAPAADSPAPESGLGVRLGARPLWIGMQGPDVETLQGVLRAKRFGPTALNGAFDRETAEAVHRFERSVRLPADGIADRRTTRALVRRMRIARATFYGPGLYGNRTACGQTLTPGTLGVAHKTLPCGTLVTVAHRGRFLRTTVIDRGPFRAGYAWDLTSAAARAVGMRSSSAIRTVHERPGVARAHRAGRISH